MITALQVVVRAGIARSEARSIDTFAESSSVFVNFFYGTHPGTKSPVNIVSSETAEPPYQPQFDLFEKICARCEASLFHILVLNRQMKFV